MTDPREKPTPPPPRPGLYRSRKTLDRMRVAREWRIAEGLKRGAKTPEEAERLMRPTQAQLDAAILPTLTDAQIAERSKPKSRRPRLLA